MKLYDSQLYLADLQTAIKQTLNIKKMQSASVMITGASGLIGSFLVDLLIRSGNDITVYAIGRNKDRLNKRFEGVGKGIIVVEQDISEKPTFDFDVDYIIHAAGNAHPSVFHKDPVGTILSNIQGTKYLLDYGHEHGCKRFLYISSGEVYGQDKEGVDSFQEDYGGYVDPVQPRSCYPNSKRTAETLCASYTKQYGLDTVIVRPCHTYGPNATSSDNRANVQFINNAVAGRDIVLNSAGNQMRSYCYIADSVSAILTVLLNGKTGEAYNIANPDVTVTIAEFAWEVARQAGRNVIFNSPDSTALAERTPIAKQVLNTTKIESLGWHGSYGLAIGIRHILAIMRGE